MTFVENITCANHGAFYMHFTVEWLGDDGLWKQSPWKSPSFATGRVVTTPSLTSPEVGCPPDAPLVRPLVRAVAGREFSGSACVRPANNGKGAAYDVRGLTGNFSVDPVTLPEIPKPPPEWANWSGNLVHQPAADGATYYHSPTRQEELKVLVAELAELRKTKPVTVRVSGQRHSQPPLVVEDNRGGVPPATNAYIIDLSCYADLGPEGDQTMVLDLSDATRPRVTVNTGVREDALEAFLTEHDLMLKTATAGGFFSVGGMTAVDVHGATVNAPIFSETASAFTILRADGSTASITASPPVDGWSPLQFARVSLGGLGIVTSVTLDVMPRPYATTLSHGTDAFTATDEQSFLARFKTVLTHDRVETFLNPYSGEFLVLRWDVDDSPSEKTPNAPQPTGTACALAALDDYGAPEEGLFVEGVTQALAQGAQRLAQWDTPLVGADAVISLAFREIKKLNEAAAEAHSDLWLAQAARVIFMSYFIELPDLGDAGLSTVWKGLEAISSRVKQDDVFHVAGPIEFRFIKGGDSAMSGTYTTNADAHFVNLDLIGFVPRARASDYPAELLQFFADVERDWVALNGFPHNGKMYGFYDPTAAEGTCTAPFNPAFLADLRKRRGARLTAFNEYRKSQDPTGLFYNDYLRSILEGDS